MTAEGKIKSEIRTDPAYHHTGVRLFNIVVGTFRALTSEAHYKSGVPGMADTCGWREIVITPDMVGNTVAVFVSNEIKQPGEKPKPHQLNWLQRVRAAGGIACISHSAEESRDQILSPFKGIRK